MLGEAAWTDAISSAGGRGWVFCQTTTEACSSVSREPAVATHRWAGQVLTCPPAAPNYDLILLLVALFEQSGKTSWSPSNCVLIKKDMGHLMDVSVELQYLFYPLHQMHNVWLFVPFPYLLYMYSMTRLKAKCCRIYIITYQPHCVSFRHFYWQAPNKKQRHTYNKTEFCNDSMQILNSTS